MSTSSAYKKYNELMTDPNTTQEERDEFLDNATELDALDIYCNVFFDRVLFRATNLYGSLMYPDMDRAEHYVRQHVKDCLKEALSAVKEDTLSPEGALQEYTEEAVKRIGSDLSRSSAMT